MRRSVLPAIRATACSWSAASSPTSPRWLGQRHSHVARFSLGDPRAGGSLAGVSGYQLSFGDEDITTPGDAPFVLVAMNPAALKVTCPSCSRAASSSSNEDEFTPANLKKAGYEPIRSRTARWTATGLIPVADEPPERRSHGGHGPAEAQRARCKNFFALGMMLWLYDRPLQPLLEWLMRKFQQDAGGDGGQRRQPARGLQLRQHRRVVPRPLSRGAGQAARRAAIAA